MYFYIDFPQLPPCIIQTHTSDEETITIYIIAYLMVDHDDMGKRQKSFLHMKMAENIAINEGLGCRQI